MEDDDITIVFIDSKKKYNRESLCETSNYFNILLRGSFSESFEDREEDPKYQLPITLTDFELYLSYSRGEIELSSSNCFALYKTALFLGGGRPEEKDLLEVCKEWLLDRVLIEDVDDLKLDDTVRFWDFGREHECRWMSTASESHICRNFMWAALQDSFVKLPADLLWNCLQSKDLTVDSGRHLYDALIVWLLANKSQEKMETYNLIRSCIRTSVLPPQFMEEASKKLCLSNEDLDLDMNPRVRLSRYSKKMELDGCSTLTTRNLFQSLLQDETTDFFPAYFLDNWPDNIRWPVGFPFITFKRMIDIHISRGHRLNPYPTIDFFQKSFPYLKKLTMSHFPTLSTFDICKILFKLPLLEELDVSVDIHPMVATKCNWTHYMPYAFGHTARLVRHDCHHEYDIESPKLKRLVLMGRIDLTDNLLCHMGHFASGLVHLNITACTLLSDHGISRFLVKCKNMSSLLAAETALSDYSLAYIRQRKWTVLDISGCQGLAGQPKEIGNSLAIQELGLRGIPVYEGSLSQVGCELLKLDVSGDSGAHVSKDMISSLLRRNCKLEELSIGFGLTAVEDLSPSLKTINIGLGATLPYNGLTTIAQQCPNLESISLKFQGISHKSFIEAGKHLTCLKALSLSCCRIVVKSDEEISEDDEDSISEDDDDDDYSILEDDEEDSTLKMEAIAHYFPALLKLTLEGLTPLLSNSTLKILIENCPNIIELGLSGCELLNSDTMEIITSGWQRLIHLHLKDCGTITVNGVGSLFDLKGMENLLLCHNGAGIDQNFIFQARSRLPSLRVLSLDRCDYLGEVEIPKESGGGALRFLLLVTCGQGDDIFTKKTTCSVTEVFEWSSQRGGSSLNRWKFKGPIQSANLRDFSRVDIRYSKTSSKSLGISVVYGDLE